MPTTKKVKLRAAFPGVAGGTIINIDTGDLFNQTGAHDFDRDTVIIVRAFVKPTPTSLGYFSTKGEIATTTTSTNGFHFKEFGNNGNNFRTMTYRPSAEEPGIHTLVITAVEDDVGHTYRAGPIKVT